MKTPIEQLCDEFQAPLPSPCGGSAAATTAAVAASLVVMVGRASPEWNEAEATASAASSLRQQLIALFESDVESVEAVVVAIREERTGLADPDVLRAALLEACRVPLTIAENAADVAILAWAASQHGRPPMRPDASAAASLASTAAEVALAIVLGNLAAPQLRGSDPEVQRLREATAVAARRAAAFETVGAA